MTYIPTGKAMYNVDAPYWQLAKKGMIEARKNSVRSLKEGFDSRIHDVRHKINWGWRCLYKYDYEE